jgi:hypothetical protein
MDSEPKSAEDPLLINVGFTGKLPDSKGERKIAARISIPREYEAADGANLNLEFN